MCFFIKFVLVEKHIYCIFKNSSKVKFEIPLCNEFLMSSKKDVKQYFAKIS